MQELDLTDIKRVLVVVAHPDDAEYGTSAAVASWVKKGIEVGYLLLTAGEAGMQRPPEEAGPIRALEQQNACKIVGVQSLNILSFPDGELEYGLHLRRAIAREIRAFRPDAVVCGSGQLEVPWGFDHADHRVAGLAAIDAVRDADNRWVFTDLLDETPALEPWGVTWLWLTGVEATHFEVLTESERDLAVASLAAHELYLADLPWHPAPQDFIPPMLEAAGKKFGVQLAMGFQAHQMRG